MKKHSITTATDYSEKNLQLGIETTPPQEGAGRLDTLVGTDVTFIKSVLYSSFAPFTSNKQYKNILHN